MLVLYICTDNLPSPARDSLVSAPTGACDGPKLDRDSSGNSISLAAFAWGEDAAPRPVQHCKNRSIVLSYQ